MMYQHLSLTLIVLLFSKLLFAQIDSSEVTIDLNPNIKLTAINFYGEEDYSDFVLRLGDNKKVNTRKFENDKIRSVTLINVKKGTTVILYDSKRNHTAHRKNYSVITVNNSFRGTYKIPNIGQKHSDRYVTISPRSADCRAGANGIVRCEGIAGKISRIRINCSSSDNCRN